MAGTKRKTGENRWRLEYMYENERYSQYISASSPTEANRKLALFVAEVEKGQYSRQNSITLTEFSQMFLDKYAIPNLSDTTVINYACQLNKYILPELGKYKLVKLKRIHIQDFANKLLSEYNLSTKTIKNYIKLISSILEKAIQWDYIHENVAKYVTIPTNYNKPKKEQEIYNNEEIKLLFDALEGEPDPFKTMVYVSFYTGARRGEVLALRWQDIDFNNNIIHIIQNKIRKKDGTKIKETKNKRTRSFVAPQILMNKLKEIHNNQNPSDLIFDYYPATYTRIWQQFIERKNLKYITLHDLRHTNGSILASKGVDIVTIANRLGHLPATASAYYLHAVSEEDKKASQKLENLF
ncbi:MAG: site-specific integrase [Lachnospiraceae bacterium]|nr:site-specific integrase [Lachnospiraceae bacterium]